MNKNNNIKVAVKNGINEAIDNNKAAATAYDVADCAGSALIPASAVVGAAATAGVLSAKGMAVVKVAMFTLATVTIVGWGVIGAVAVTRAIRRKAAARKAAKEAEAQAEATAAPAEAQAEAVATPAAA